jgi:hypothetical protein
LLNIKVKRIKPLHCLYSVKTAIGKMIFILEIPGKIDQCKSKPTSGMAKNKVEVLISIILFRQ